MKNTTFLFSQIPLKLLSILYVLLVLSPFTVGYTQTAERLYRISEPIGKLTPKSIRHNGHGIFSAQNMMYSHSISFYDRSFNLVHVLSDSVNLSDYGICQYDHWYRGAPVECDFSEDGRFAYVSNYKLYGPGLEPEAYDNCAIDPNNEVGYVYKIRMDDFDIVDVYPAGSVPKYVLSLEGIHSLAVTNWCSGTVSIINELAHNDKKEIFVGPYPRGIAQDGHLLYVAVMGSNYVSIIDLNEFKIIGKIVVGSGPRDLRIDPERRRLYVSLNNINQITAVDLDSEAVTRRWNVGKQPRSMAYDQNRQLLFFTHYGDHAFGWIDLIEGQMLPSIKTCYKPIGIEYDTLRQQLWVSCYGGNIDIYDVSLKDGYAKRRDTAESLAIIKTVKPHSSDIKNRPSKVLPTMNNPSENDLALVIGSFSVLENAENRARDLSDKGIPCQISQTERLHRVIAYHGNDIDYLLKKKQILEDQFGVKSWILNKP